MTDYPHPAHKLGPKPTSLSRVRRSGRERDSSRHGWREQDPSELVEGYRIKSYQPFMEDHIEGHGHAKGSVSGRDGARTKSERGGRDRRETVR